MDPPTEPTTAVQSTPSVRIELKITSSCVHSHKTKVLDRSTNVTYLICYTNRKKLLFCGKNSMQLKFLTPVNRVDFKETVTLDTVHIFKEQLCKLCFICRR